MRESECQLTDEKPDPLVVIQGGIDLRRTKPTTPGQAYEDMCFKLAAKDKPSGSLVLGPHAVERALHPGISRGSIPDAITMGVIGDMWMLTDLYEFKSGKGNYHFGKKLDGFSVFLATFRENPNLMPTALREVLEATAATIMIPEESVITVHFFSHNPYPPKRLGELRTGSQFQLDFRSVPRSLV